MTELYFSTAVMLCDKLSVCVTFGELQQVMRAVIDKGSWGLVYMLNAVKTLWVVQKIIAYRVQYLGISVRVRECFSENFVFFLIAERKLCHSFKTGEHLFACV